MSQLKVGDIIRMKRNDRSLEFDNIRLTMINLYFPDAGNPYYRGTGVLENGEKVFVNTYNKSFGVIFSR